MPASISLEARRHDGAKARNFLVLGEQRPGFPSQSNRGVQHTPEHPNSLHSVGAAVTLPARGLRPLLFTKWSSFKALYFVD